MGKEPVLGLTRRRWQRIRLLTLFAFFAKVIQIDGDAFFCRCTIPIIMKNRSHLPHLAILVVSFCFSVAGCTLLFSGLLYGQKQEIVWSDEERPILEQLR